MGVSENVVYPIVPNGFADHYPVMKNGKLSLGRLTQHFQVQTQMIKIYHIIIHRFTIINHRFTIINHY